MTPKPPAASKKQVNKAGIILITKKSDSPDYKEALKIANEWRLAHVYPINTFQARLRKSVKKYSEPIVAQRLKRMPTIIDKLDRHPNMKLSTMQDIGGVRAVLNSIKEVNEVANLYLDSQRFTHILKDKRDYIESPKPDGYRGIHLIYRYNNTLARNDVAKLYEGLLVEIQLRTKEQHHWATAVETMGLILDQPFKTRGGAKDWHEFFALMSSAIAIVEETNVLEAHQDLEPHEIYGRIKAIDAEIRARDAMRGYTYAANIIQRNDIGFYNIIILDTKNKQVSIRGYAKDDYKKAVRDYAIGEQKSDEFTDLVLVSAGRLKSLQLAYPNYFLDISTFLERVKIVIEEISM